MTSTKWNYSLGASRMRFYGPVLTAAGVQYSLPGRLKNVRRSVLMFPEEYGNRPQADP